MEPIIPVLTNFPPIFKTFGVDVSFDVVPPLSPSAGDFIYTCNNPSVATIDQTTGHVTIHGAGTASIEVTQFPSQFYTSPLSPIITSLIVSKGVPFLSEFNIANKTYGADISFSLLSQNEVDYIFTQPSIYTSSNTNVASVDESGIVTIHNAGTTSLVISKVGKLTVSKGETTLSGLSIGKPKVYGVDVSFTIVPPTSTSDGGFMYTSSNASVATINSITGHVTIYGAGTTTITANQLETANYHASSTPISTILSVIRGKPTITAAIPKALSRVYGTPECHAPIDLFTGITSISESPGQIVVSSSNPNIASIDPSSNMVTIHRAGNVSLFVTQLETANYEEPIPVTVTLIIHKGTPTISGFYSLFKTPTSYAGGYTASGQHISLSDVTYSNDSQVIITSSTPSVASIVTPNIIAVHGAGTTSISIIKSADDNYNAKIFNTTLHVSKGIPAISNFSVGGVKTFSHSSVDLSFSMVTPTSNNMDLCVDGVFTNGIIVTSSNHDVATSPTQGNDGNLHVEIHGPGSSVFTATIPETSNYTSAAIQTTLYVVGAKVDLSGANLSGADLTRTSFRGANLTNVNFTNTTLSCVDISGANITGVTFTIKQKLDLLRNVHNRNIPELKIYAADNQPTPTTQDDAIMGASLARHVSTENFAVLSSIPNALNYEFKVFPPRLGIVTIDAATTNAFYIPTLLGEKEYIMINGTSYYSDDRHVRKTSNGEITNYIKIGNKNYKVLSESIIGIEVQTIDFNIGSFNSVMEMLETISMGGVEYTLPDVSACGVFYVKTSDMRNIFQFRTDLSTPVLDLSALNQDPYTNNLSTNHNLRYYTFKNRMPSNFILNPAHAMMDMPESLTSMTPAESPPTKSLLKHDFIRYLAFKLFGTINGVDLFANEQEMLDDITDKGHEVWKEIERRIELVSTTTRSQELMFFTDSMNHKYLTNLDTSYNNICREIFQQVIKIAPERFADITDTFITQPIPFMDGDSFNFKLTLVPASGQGQLIGEDITIGSRTYNIKLVMKSDTFAVNTQVIDSDWYPYDYPYSW
jgi:hypothetical protein